MNAVKRVFTAVAALFAFILVFTACSNRESTQQNEAPPPELSDVLERVVGHWVDKEFYYSPVIDNNVLWLFERVFHLEGDYQGVSFTEWGGRPLSAHIIGGTGMPTGIFPLVMQSFKDGIVELTIDHTMPVVCFERVYSNFDNDDFCYCHFLNSSEYAVADRIVIDTTRPDINEITYFTEGSSYTLVRFDWERDPSRYYIERTQDGIKVNYFAGLGSFPRFSEEIFVYRSAVYGERGERLLTFSFTNWESSAFYEFIDITAKPGQTYYYSVWPYREWQTSEEPLTFGGRWQMAAHP
jgi:hypothetical protein